MYRFVLMSLLASGYWLITAPPAEAQTQPQAWSNECVGFTDVATIKGLECLFANILSIALQGLGLVMFLMLLFGGIKYLTAGGDPKALESAKGTLTLAIGGLVLAVLAWFILVFIGNVTGVTQITNFKIGI